MKGKAIHSVRPEIKRHTAWGGKFNPHIGRQSITLKLEGGASLTRTPQDEFKPHAREWGEVPYQKEYTKLEMILPLNYR